MTLRAVIGDGRMRAASLMAVVAVLALSAVGLAEAQTSEHARIVAALRTGNTYVSPIAFSAATAQQVRADAAELLKQGEKVKLAAVQSTGGLEIFAYAAQLRSALKYSGTLVVTTPHGTVGAAGSRSELSVQNALLAVGADRVVDPAARLLIAAQVSKPPPSDTGTGIRDLVVLVGLALLGGAFAIGWGLRREEHRARDRVMELRGILKVYVDALGARAVVLATRANQTTAARALVEAVHAYHVAALALVDHGLTEPELAEGAASVRGGLYDAERAGGLLGVELPATDPFADLCVVDPAHGPPVHDGDDGPLCADCAEQLEAGHELVPRRVLVAGQPVSYRDAPVPYGVTTPPGAPAARMRH
jgi:hypothetical protein